MKRDDPQLVEFSADAGSARLEQAPRSAAPSRPSLEARLMRRLLAALGDPPLQVTLWNGESLFTGRGDPAAHMRIANRSALIKLLVNPEMHFGDAYSEGSIEIDGDLVGLMEVVYHGLARTSGSGGLRRLAGWFDSRRPNTIDGSRDNIHHHYDLGNEFYRLWLDRDMVYTCAYFPHPQAGLEEAQAAKMDHVCRKLALRPGETVVEAGCGWGALALHMAMRYGVKVRAFNISREQIAWATARARALGAEDRVEFIEDDYRNIRGHFDAFVSVGMLEHVGPERYDDLGAVIDRCLDGRGRGLIHSIGRVRPAPLNPWIEKRIFPGAYPPSLAEMLAILEPRNLAVLDVENLRRHYARTLEHWLRRFEAARERVRGMYGEPFTRAWRLYLSGALASFNTGDLQLFQVLFAPQAGRELPWTRAHLYGGPASPGGAPD